MKIGSYTIGLLILAICFTNFDACASDSDVVLSELREVRIKVLPKTLGLTAIQIENSVELKLRQSGINVTEDALAELQVLVQLTDVDRTQKKVVGKYGTVSVSLFEPVKLTRKKNQTISARTWEGNIMLFVGPPETIAGQIERNANFLIDSFLVQWFKANQETRGSN